MPRRRLPRCRRRRLPKLASFHVAHPGAAVRIVRPALAAGLASWRASWERAERARAAKREARLHDEKARTQEALEGKHTALEDELAKVQRHRHRRCAIQGPKARQDAITEIREAAISVDLPMSP